VSDKVKPEHLQRRAIIYVRQSTPEQVRSNLESQRRQYGLADRARQMGWTDIQVIDEDLGLSGATAANRQGFQRLVAAVCVNEVGAVFSIEASRLARNNRDWHQLIDFCSMVGTLIIDFDGIYDPRVLNDRLLLGLKGTMSEFELSLIRQRSQEALRGMIQRGELITTLPVGYVRSRDNRCEKTPDVRIQHVVQMVFSKFAETGSIRQTLLWFRKENVAVPQRRNGAEEPIVEWRLPLYGTLHKMLLNPIYAGAYAYGRTCTRTTVEDGQAQKTRGHRQEREEWTVLLRDHHDGYISWEQYEQNQKRIQENVAMKGSMIRGPVRNGKSLAAGLLRCRRCGRKLHVTYSGAKGDVPRYSCRGAMINHGEGKCLSFGGLALDRALEHEVLHALEPAAIEAAIKMANQVGDEDDQKQKALRLELQQATYEAQRARRQFDAVDPENRLVAAELEKRWNAALARVAALEAELAVEPSGSRVSQAEAASLLKLAEEFPAIWDHPETDMRLKKRLVRTLVEEIVVDVDEQRAVVQCVIHWAGGIHTQLSVRKNRTGQHRYSTEKTAVELVTELAKVASDRDMATVLNRLRLTTGKNQSWTESRVRSLRVRLGVPVFSPDRQKEQGWLNMAQAAQALGISAMSVRRLLGRGILRGSQVVPFSPWVIPCSALADNAVRAAVQAIKSGQPAPLPAQENQLKLDLEPLS
jgi:DNA invertase Pin-like site-specific DNA recombinase